MNDLINELLRETKQLQDCIHDHGNYLEIRWLVHGWAKKWQPTIIELFANIDRYPSIEASMYFDLFYKVQFIDLDAEEKRMRE